MAHLQTHIRSGFEANHAAYSVHITLFVAIQVEACVPAAECQDASLTLAQVVLNDHSKASYYKEQLLSVYVSLCLKDLPWLTLPHLQVCMHKHFISKPLQFFTSRRKI